MRKFFYIICIIFSITSCVNNHEKRGYAFDLVDSHLLQEGISSKEAVLKIMGSPTIVSDFNDEESWIYYSEEVNKVLFFLPKVISRKILVIKFDEFDSIKYLKEFNLANEEQKLEFAKNYTAVKSHKVGFFKSIFSNIGQIKPQ